MSAVELWVTFTFYLIGTFGLEQEPRITVVAREGSDVILLCSLSTNQNIESKLFDWTKDAQRDEPRKEVFLYEAGSHYNNGRSGQSVEFKGRVFHFPDELNHGNASITIRRTTIDDRGNYTCFFPRLQTPQRFQVELVVDAELKDRRDIPGAAQKPYIKIPDETKHRSLLQCEAHGSPEPKVEWKDSGGNTLPAEKPHVSETGGRYDIILQTNVTKTGRYRCVVTQETIYHQVSAETFVYISGAAPKPSVTILDETKDWSLLQCEVRGASPEPKVEWKDSDGNTLPAKEPEVTGREGRYDIILQTTVTKTDNYRCVVTQETIHHQTSAEIHVYICGNGSEEPSGSNAGWIIAAVLGALLVGGVVLLAGLVYKGYITLNRSKSKGPGPAAPSPHPADPPAGEAVPLNSVPPAGGGEP